MWIAQRQFDGNPRLLPHPPPAVHFEGSGLRKVAHPHLVFRSVAVFAAHRDPRALLQRFCRHAERQLQMGRFARQHRGRQQPLPFTPGESREGMLQPLRIVRIDPHGPQDHLLRRAVVVA